MAVNRITIFGFHGMYNLPNPSATLPDQDQERKFTPRLVINADVLDSGVILPRNGYASAISLPGVHSLAGEEKGLSVLLAVANEVLYRVEGTTLMPLAVVGPRAQMNYAEVNNQVFCSSPSWNGIYDLLSGEVRPWGISLPGAPEIALVDGDLPPGRYSLAYTRLDAGGRLSGNGPLKQVMWEGISRGIQLNNLEDGLVPWITHPDGGKLFLPEVNSQNQITAQAPTIQPLVTQGMLPPPRFAHFCWAHGRLWGVNGKNLHYSEPGQYEWFKRGGYLPSLEELIMVVPYNGGLYLHSRTSSWCLDGTDPAKMTLKRVGEGAIPGTLTYASVPAGIAGGAATSAIFAKISKMPTPMWMSPAGVIVGTHGGNLANLTSSQLAISARQRGAALTRDLDGVPQILISQSGLSDDYDQELQEIFAREGKLFD